ncbi:coiled-coil domain-containing protein 9B isoform X1 [Coregonus clupeaformis]|uniref:coiled-coil domain-containing protein 9B isoform X1 n=2 Tax=Coregonus clupeaformis TaxID=59861 RepID=UPI001E1C8AA1|nr:coiled-coil domain-containing protein 9B isoform X1 [Coregonus clupeaformis]
MTGRQAGTFATPSDVMLKKEKKDVELDKKIEALRKKNEALMKRYQEVEEDKKRAEEEGMALQSPKGKAGDLTITINKSTSQEPRVVMTKPGMGGSPTPKWVQEPGVREAEGNLLCSGRGRRKQLLVTMAGNTKGKRVVSERLERRPGPLDVKSPTENNQHQHRVGSAARGKHQHTHTAKRDTGPQDEVGQGKCLTEERHWLSECEPYHQESEGLGPAGDIDLTIPMSKEEQQEYLCWKMEREQIDRERVARHKNAKGQWRRAWDMDKTENMFSDKSPRERERGPTARGGRNARRGHPKSNADSRGQQLWGKDNGGRNVPVVSSKAKGKDRLTGRATRWDANEDGEDLQASKTSLEEFLEELDALADPDIDDSTAETPEVKDGDLKMESSPTLEVVNTKEVSGSVSPQAPADTPEVGTPRQGKAEASSPQATEKKVRFSEELIKGPGAYEKPSTGAQNSACSETKGISMLKVASPSKNGHQLEEQRQSPEDHQEDAGNVLDWGDQPAAADQAQSSSDGQRQGQEGPPFLDASKTECAEIGHDGVLSLILPISHSDVKDPAPPQENAVQPLEHAKSNTEELIDSSLSVLSLESGETHPTHTTSTDKDARRLRWEKETIHVQLK